MSFSLRIFSAFILLSGIFIFVDIQAQVSAANQTEIFESDFFNKSVIRIRFLKDNLLRIQVTQKGNKFRETALNRYGFIQEPATGDLKVKFNRSGNIFTAATSKLKLTGNRSTGEIIITDLSGRKVFVDQTAANFSDSSSHVVFRAGKDEDWIGFGDQSRERIYQRGFIADCHVRNVQSYIPVPFFMSVNGAAILVNTSFRIIFDMCKTSRDSYSWTDYSGSVDYYLFTGAGYRELIDSYTELTGRPKLPPEWAFGLWYICRTQANDYEAVNDALNFRREEIPCDVIGLEPGWMEKNYDFSTKKAWSRSRFPIPDYARNGPHNFINSIKRMGFKMELWLCNDYDLAYEEDRRLVTQATGSRSGKPGSNLYNFVEADGHLAKVEEKEAAGSKEEHAGTKNEPWFEHLKKFVDQGADFFKQDGSNQVLDHKGKIWGNGMPDKELHNLYPLFYSRQMYEGFKEYTNRRPVVFTPCGWTGFQSWSGTWTGDTGGRLSTLGAMLNTSVVGHSWSTNDMEVTEKEGIHFGYLQPWSQINSWNYFRMPWIQGAELTAMHKFYSRLRSRLVPYIYSWAYYSTRSGWPLLIPLTMEFPDDKNCRNNLHQYLLGRDLLVGIYRDTIYFPKGLWKDYWTGSIVQGDAERKISWPDDRGGALYVRSGAIIPFGPVMQYRGEKPMNEITLYIFPDQNGSEFNFYEDDGTSFEYLQGKYSLTHISEKAVRNMVTVEIGASEGGFKRTDGTREWNIIMHADKSPVSVQYNDNPHPANKISWDDGRKELTIKGINSPAVIQVKN
jgi:alpha-glucosidase